MTGVTVVTFSTPATVVEVVDGAATVVAATTIATVVELTGKVGPRGPKGDTGDPGPAGATDHGALTGLDDDDHPQYLTEGRGDLRYDALGTATTAVSAHAGATDPHGDRAWATGQFQPLDSDLTAIAALSTTSFGRGLLALADAAALRSAGGLVIGTDIYSKAAIDSGFQPLDSDLTAIAALSTTTFGRSLLALADAAAGRTALGLGGAATLNVGTTAGTVAAGDDSRFTDSRTPTGSAGGDLTGTYPNPTIGAGKVTSTHILDGTIVNGDISTSAAIALSKLAQPANAAVTMTAWSLFA